MPDDAGGSSAPSSVSAPAVNLTNSLEDFQLDEQRLVLDTVAQIRKCGLEAVLPLPQVVVCGNQSSGKSSVLEGLTEHYPAENRSAAEKATINAFSATIADFAELPGVISKAATAQGINPSTNDSSAAASTRAFAKDVLSFEIEGPTRPQLTVVDVPGLIQNTTKGVTEQDKGMVAEITDFYIKQRRTICRAAIQATDDYANQPILTKVREVDPEGNRTLGIITKPDRLDPNSGTESAFLALARNEDVFFKLGWHVVQNRKFEESNYSIMERNLTEDRFFRDSNREVLPPDCGGIEALRTRLSSLLFDHIKQELPALRQDLDAALMETNGRLDKMGSQRATTQECRNYLTKLSLECLEITKAALDGHYEGEYLQNQTDTSFDVGSPASVRRLRAAIQFINRGYAERMRTRGPKYFIPSRPRTDVASKPAKLHDLPASMSHQEALDWVSRVLVRSRGKEPIWNYNPLIIGELFCEQSTKWKALTEDHVDQVADMCKMFTKTLLENTCPKDVLTRLSELKIKEALESRKAKATAELLRILEDKQDFPAVYNQEYQAPTS
ncbi:hypothetical protein LTR09_012624 [Extremus antarcticus]|uniref:Dynamin-type G domain-containing protein n=1 Tax=Extremus antarcticus TaxID=702011 RepID=A0AAJ0D4P8_9PEZI|nr:hypothetical protein LTR09_012624 [Extremus antarcticus]